MASLRQGEGSFCLGREMVADDRAGRGWLLIGQGESGCWLARERVAADWPGIGWLLIGQGESGCWLARERVAAGLEANNCGYLQRRWGAMAEVSLLDPCVLECPNIDMKKTSSVITALLPPNFFVQFARWFQKFFQRYLAIFFFMSGNFLIQLNQKGHPLWWKINGWFWGLKKSVIRHWNTYMCSVLIHRVQTKSNWPLLMYHFEEKEEEKCIFIYILLWRSNLIFFPKRSNKIFSDFFFMYLVHQGAFS